MNSKDDHFPARRKKSMVTKVVQWTLGISFLLVLAGYITFQVSPWPGVLTLRVAFKQSATWISRGLEKHVPVDVSAQLNQHYDISDNDAYLDVFYPSALENSKRALPTVVWVHGGGWVSGSKAQVTNYCRILAGRGYTVVAVGYSLAPARTYPVPVRQVNVALSYLAGNARRLHVNPEQFVLAGDSAGAHIAAQLANVISEPSYAKALNISPSIDRKQLAGVILYCGPYNLRQITPTGFLGGFLNKAMFWSYSGSKDFTNDPRFTTASVIHYVTSTFPATFISAGNGDPLPVGA